MSGVVVSRRALLALAGAGLAEVALVACSGSSGTRAATSAGRSATAPVSPATSSRAGTATGSRAATGTPTHVRLYQNDGETYGVGMPIIAYLTAITDARPFAQATRVTAGGRPVAGAWHFEKSAIYSDYPIEAHYRPRDFWPAHSAIELDLPVKGLSAGKGLVFDDGLRLSMRTGAANITTVDGAAERLVLTSDGQEKFRFPVSLGKASTPTFAGTKVLMERHRVERMVGTTPGDRYDLEVPWSCRLTNSGEYIHAARWNGGNIGRRSTSNGCTNLNVAAARKFYKFSQVGDVAIYTNVDGPTMPSWDGYGDWNLDWSQWRTGGLVRTV